MASYSCLFQEVLPWGSGLLLLKIVLCEYSKFLIESNSYFSIGFDSKRAQLFEIFECLLSPISYLFNRMTPIFHLRTTRSNQQNQQTWSATTTTETTIVLNSAVP